MSNIEENRFSNRLVIPVKRQELIRKIHQYDNIFEQCNHAYKACGIERNSDSESKYYIRLIHKGERKIIIDNETHNLKAGSILLINPGQPHCIETNVDKEIETYTMILTESFIKQFLTTFKEKDKRLLEVTDLDLIDTIEFQHQHITNQPEIGYLIKKSIVENSEIYASGFARELFIQEILFYLLSIEFKEYLQLKNYENESLTIREEIKSRIEVVIEFLHSKYNEKVSLKECAKIANMSEAHFRKLFKKITGVSPYQYLVTIRLDKAKDMIKYSKKSITEIAFDLGYPSIASFTKAFRNYTGVPPSEFRQKVK